MMDAISVTPPSRPTIQPHQVMNYVAGFMFERHPRTKKVSVLLIQKTKPEWQKGKFNAIGGKIEAIDESPSHAMVREFLEETGIPTKPEDWELAVVLTNKKVVGGYCVYFFRGRQEMPIHQAKSMTDEKVAIINLPLTDHNQVIPNLHWLIPLVLDQTLRIPIHIEDIGTV